MDAYGWFVDLMSRIDPLTAFLLTFMLYELSRIRKRLDEIEERLDITREEVAYIRGRVNGRVNARRGG